MQNQTFKRFPISTKAVDPNKTLDDVDPELLEMYKKLGISVDEQNDEYNMDIGRFRFSRRRLKSR
jgi:hypothetical protein